jgi:hypothetical protein
MSKEKRWFDFIRFAKFTAFNFIYTGPAQFIIFNKIFPIIAPEIGFRAVIKKVAFTQLFTGPIGLAFFFFTIALMERHTV